ncbi:MAG TPA: hypothetical protein VGA77_10880 [Propylenella sp.]
MRPFLLRSAGIVGLAGSIMAVISSDALLVDSRDAPGGEIARLAEDAGPAEAAEVAAAATLRPLMPGFEPGAGAFAPAPTILTREPLEERFAALGEKRSAAPAVAPQQLRESEAASERQTASAAPAVDAPAADLAPAAVPEKAIAMAAPEAASREPSSADAAMVERMTASPPEVDGAAALGSRTLPQGSAAAAAPAPRAPPPPSSAGDAAEPATGSLPEEGSQGADESVWTEHAVDCPREWVAASGEASGETACGTTMALLQPDVAADDDAAVEEAMLDHARQIGALLPRIPQARPEAPAWVKRASAPRARRPDNSWPDAPPPNCGKLHAYWRFVDRKAGTKEWYCK